MSDILRFMQETPIQTILIIAGIIFLFLAIVGKLPGRVQVSAERQKWAGIIGLFLLILGVLLYSLSPKLTKVSERDQFETKINALQNEIAKQATKISVLEEENRRLQIASSSTPDTPKPTDVLQERSISIEDLKKGIVRITATVYGKRNFASGFIAQLVRNAVYLVTAAHVVEGSREVKVEFYTQRHRQLSAKVVSIEGADPKGMAVLMVEGDIPSDLLVLTIDKGVALQAGDDILVIGCPQIAGPWSVSKGSIVSMRGRDITLSAPVDYGSSGSPVFGNGQVIGMVVGSFGKLGLAVPAYSIYSFLSGSGVKPSLLSKKKLK